MYKKIIVLTVLLYTSICVRASNMDSLIYKMKNANKNEKIALLITISNEYLSSSPPKSLYYIEEAIQLAKEKNNIISLIKAYRIKGVASYLNGDINHAGEYYYKALKIAENAKNKTEIAATLVNLGGLSNVQGNLEDAMRFYQQALVIYTDLKKFSGMAKIENNIGLLFSQQKKGDAAMMHFKNALKINEVLKDNQGMAHVYGNMSIVYDQNGNYSKAILYSKKSIAISLNTGDYYGTISALNGLGTIYSANKNTTKAIIVFEQALDLAKKGHYQLLIRECYKNLFDVYADKKEFSKTKEYLNLYLIYNDSIVKEEHSKQLEEMQIKYESEKKNEEIDLLKKDKKIQNLEISFQKNIRDLMIVLFILIVSALIIIVRLYQVKKISERRLNELNKTKDKLFSIIAHDLRTPINGVLVITEYLANPNSNPEKEEMKKYLEKLNKVTEDINLLLENLLQWAISQTEVSKLSISEFDLKEMALKTIRTFCFLAENKKIEIKCFIPDGVIVNSDLNLMRIILRNLISNAVKFSKENGVISITVKDLVNYWEVSVIDKGVGIKKENLTKLFKLGSIHTTNGTSKEKGTGLGLILCKEFTEKLGGEIRVESKEGEGSKFIFSIKK